MQDETSHSPLGGPSLDPRQRLLQIRRTTASYRRQCATDPVLPSAESPLPALLAVRNSSNQIGQSKQTIQDIQERIKASNERLLREDQNLKDAQYLASALEKRIEKLRVDESEQAQRQPHEIASKLSLGQQNRKLYFAREMRGLVKSFNRFVNEHLAVMLAAEDLGGPIVGDALDLDESSLNFGFTQQGKAKKKASESTSYDQKRLQRNAQIWGATNGDDDNEDLSSEKEAAAASFRHLTESLLNAAEANESDPYISIPKENATARFLVRAQVARFHPDDAKRLRLLNFGERLDE